MIDSAREGRPVSTHHDRNETTMPVKLPAGFAIADQLNATQRLEALNWPPCLPASCK